MSFFQYLTVLASNRRSGAAGLFGHPAAAGEGTTVTVAWSALHVPAGEHTDVAGDGDGDGGAGLDIAATAKSTSSSISEFPRNFTGRKAVG